MKDIENEIKCPNCGRRLRIKVKEMIPGTSKRCACGCQIKFTGDDGRKVQRALDDLERALRRLGRPR